MSGKQNNQQDSSEDTSSLSERFRKAQSLVESSPDQAVTQLTQLQEQIAALALFSSNETSDDVSTKSLSLLALEYSLAMAHLQVRTSKSTERKQHVQQSQALLVSFLQRLEQLELLNKEQIRDFHALLDASSAEEEDGISSTLSSAAANQQRDAKIARFRAKRQAQQEVERLESLKQRRSRLGTEPQEEMDGFDDESLQRQVALTQLSIHATEAIDEYFQAQRELPMIDMAIKMEQQRAARERHGGASSTQQQEKQRPPPQPSNKPFQLTHITKDSTTGQLQVRKEELKSQVFRPGWNQPTMTLQELGERELAQAKEREARQQQSEVAQQNAPRRYEQLVKDGMEDDADLVDASAKLDREWDEFREQNPRGSGNKMGDRGDRNF